MVWGAMIALWNISHLEHKKIYDKIDLILHLTNTGTVITHVTGIKVMLVLAETSKEYYDHLYPILLQYLLECRPVDFGKRVEDYMVIFNENNKDDIVNEVLRRKESLNKNQLKRVTKALKSKGITI